MHYKPRNKCVALFTLLNYICPLVIGMNPDWENLTAFVFDINT